MRWKNIIGMTGLAVLLGSFSGCGRDGGPEEPPGTRNFTYPPRDSAIDLPESQPDAIQRDAK